MKAEELIHKYNTGTLQPEEREKLEQYIEAGEISIDNLVELQNLKLSIEKMQAPDPSSGMTARFYEQLGKEKVKMNKVARISWFANLWQAQPAWRWAYSMVLILAGLGAGLLLKSGDKDDTDKLESLSAQVNEMKEMMMLTLLEKESASDRLKAVNLTSEMPEASSKVTDALLKTLNNDANVNVRLSALEALSPYVSHPKVREGLIKSIAHQESPLVQVALAEMMAALQEKGSVKSLQQLLKDEKTPPEVKERIEKSIEVLI